MRYIGLLLIILLFLCLTLNETWAAEETITWIGCVKEAKRQHPDLVSAAEKINEAKASKEITRSAVLPQITGAASRTTTQQPSGGGTSSGMTSASSAKRKP
ncbi:MAG: TolC family protein, partial [Candidatus Omnitrophica bacterium]|nr:TolC family protein [Candidatus Omnitrophota bacterium]